MGLPAVNVVVEVAVGGECLFSSGAGEVDEFNIAVNGVLKDCFHIVVFGL